MTDTPNLGLPLIETAQAQKHVTHNEALALLDTLVQLSVASRALTAPPASPVEGSRYIVKATGTGAFTGKENQIAQYSGGGWVFFSPRTGWLAYVADESKLLAWDGSAWVAAVSSSGDITSLQNLTLLGVGAAADTTNPFSAKLNNALWTAKTVAEGGDGTLRYKLSKESAAKTLSLLFQDNFSGRAEIGLAGDDDFHFKVSADGTNWIDALIIDKTTGAAKLNSAFCLTGDIAPTISADQNDWNPTGLSTASVLRTDGGAASRNITGLAGGGDGRIVAIVNAGANNIVLKDANASSSASNRFGFGADITLAAKQSALLWYDATDSRWKLLAGPGGAVASVFGRTGAVVAASGDYSISQITNAREVLTADRTYYVRTDGSDSNNGLANSAGGAFLTWQHAIDVVHEGLDLGGRNVTIQAGGASGTFTGGISVYGPFVGAKSHTSVQLLGDTTTPTNFLLKTTDALSVVAAQYGAALAIKGFQLQSTGGGNLLDAFYYGVIVVTGKMDFSSTTGYQIFARRLGYIDLNAAGSYTISGGAANHWRAANNSVVSAQSVVVTLTGTPAFTAFLGLTAISEVIAVGATFSGSATGSYYSIDLNSAAITGGLTLPGNAAGTTATGGQYT
jgi:hypothetical protein